MISAHFRRAMCKYFIPKLLPLRPFVIICIERVTHPGGAKLCRKNMQGWFRRDYPNFFPPTPKKTTAQHLKFNGSNASRRSQEDPWLNTVMLHIFRCQFPIIHHAMDTLGYISCTASNGGGGIVSKRKHHSLKDLYKETISIKHKTGSRCSYRWFRVLENDLIC